MKRLNFTLCNGVTIERALEEYRKELDYLQEEDEQNGEMLDNGEITFETWNELQRILIDRHNHLNDIINELEIRLEEQNGIYGLFDNNED